MHPTKLKVTPLKKSADLEKAMLDVVRNVFPQKPKAKGSGGSAAEPIFIEAYTSDIALMLIHPTIRQNLQAFIQKIVLSDQISVSAESSRRLSEELAYLVGKDVNEGKMSSDVGTKLVEQLTQDALVFKVERPADGISQGIADAYNSGKEGKDSPRFSFDIPRCMPRLAALPAWTPVG